MEDDSIYESDLLRNEQARSRAAAGSGFGRVYNVVLTAKTQVNGYDSCDAAQNGKVSDAVRTLREAGWTVSYQTI